MKNESVEARTSTIDKGKKKVSQDETKLVEARTITVDSEFDSDDDSEYDSDKSVDYLIHEAINDELDSILSNNTWVLADLPPGCKPFGCKWIFKRKLKVDGTIEKFKARLVIQGFRQKSRIDYFEDSILECKFDETDKGVIIYLYVDDMLIFDADQVQVDLIKEFLLSKFSMKDIGEADVTLVGKLSRYTSNPRTQHYNDEDNSSTSGWVFLLGGGVISWASKKQTCITGSTMEYEFVALAATYKEAKAYSKMYNGKSRHFGVRHNMIRELITNGELSIKFVRPQQNIADHLRKGLAKDLVLKSIEGMG
ncbi:zinc finger, CCHC-type containing protein [Tanacetum coccineum]